MSLLKREHGFTLIEGLVAMACAVVVFGATLTVLEVYMRQSNAVTQRFDAQNQTRLAVDRIVRQLRNVASPLTTPKLLERATPYDLVFETIGNSTSANPSGTERVRYCVPQDTTSGSASQEVLVAQTQTVATSSNDPWSNDPTVTIPCPDTTFVPSVTGDPQYTVVASSVVNRRTVNPYSAQNVFSYNNGLDSNSVIPTDLPSVSTIQINMLVNPTPAVLGATTQVQSSAYLRNKQFAPVADFTYSAIGNGGVILNGGTSYSPDGEQLSYSWQCTSSNCPTNTSLDSASDGLVPWQPGAGTYTVQLTVKDEDGLISNPSASKTVVVT